MQELKEVPAVVLHILSMHASGIKSHEFTQKKKKNGDYIEYACFRGFLTYSCTTSNYVISRNKFITTPQ